METVAVRLSRARTEYYASLTIRNKKVYDYLMAADSIVEFDENYNKYFTITMFGRSADLQYQTARNVLRQLADDGYVEVDTEQVDYRWSITEYGTSLIDPLVVFYTRKYVKSGE